MRAYFQRLENCHHRRWPPYRWLARIGIDPTRHGWSGWLQTERAIPRSALGDRVLRKVMKRALHRSPRPNRRSDQPAAMAVSGPLRLQRPAAGGGRRGRGRVPAPGHAAPREDGRTGARARGRSPVSQPPPARAERAGDPGAPRRGQSRRRGGVPAGRTALRRPSTAERRDRRAPRGPRIAGGRPRRRRVQHASALDALGHRSAGGAGASRHPGPGGSPRRGPEPAGPLRGQRGEPDGASLEGAGGGPLRPRRRPLPRVGGAPEGRVLEQWRHRRRGEALGARARVARPVPPRAAGEVRRVLPRVLRGDTKAPGPPVVDGPQGTHPEPGGRGHPALGRPAPDARGQLPLLRGRE